MSATNQGAAQNGYQDGAPVLIANIDIARLTRAECAALLGPLLARLLTTDERPPREASSEGDRLLTVTEAATLLSVTPSRLYHTGKDLGLAVKLGDGTLRFSHARVQEYMLKCAVKPRSRKR